ncbi:Stealth CR1 domain-containing protein [Lactiplantibacillus pentosus]
MLDEDIDVVIPWVDNTDPIWRDKAKQYIGPRIKSVQVK